MIIKLISSCRSGVISEDIYIAGDGGYRNLVNYYVIPMKLQKYDLLRTFFTLTYPQVEVDPVYLRPTLCHHLS